MDKEKLFLTRSSGNLPGKKRSPYSLILSKPCLKLIWNVFPSLSSMLEILDCVLYILWNLAVHSLYSQLQVLSFLKAKTSCSLSIHAQTPNFSSSAFAPGGKASSRSSWPFSSLGAPISSPGASFPLPHHTAWSSALVPLLEGCVLGAKLGTRASFYIQKNKFRYFNPYQSPICFPAGPLAKQQHCKCHTLLQEGRNEGLTWKGILKVAEKLNT